MFHLHYFPCFELYEYQSQHSLCFLHIAPLTGHINQTVSMATNGTRSNNRSSHTFTHPCLCNSFFFFIFTETWKQSAIHQLSLEKDQNIFLFNGFTVWTKKNMGSLQALHSSFWTFMNPPTPLFNCQHLMKTRLELGHRGLSQK